MRTISIKLPSNYPFVLASMTEKLTLNIFQVNNIVYHIFNGDIFLVRNSITPSLFRTSDHPVSVSSSRQICKLFTSVFNFRWSIIALSNFKLLILDYAKSITSVIYNLKSIKSLLFNFFWRFIFQD